MVFQLLPIADRTNTQRQIEQIQVEQIQVEQNQYQNQVTMENKYNYFTENLERFACLFIFMSIHFLLIFFIIRWDEGADW